MVKVKMVLELVKVEIITIFKHLFATLTSRNLFKSQVEDVNYELSPLLYFLVLDLLYHYSLVTVGVWFYVFLNIGICCIEVGLFFTTNMAVAQHAFIVCFQLLGVLASGIIVTLRQRLLDAEKRHKESQWSLQNAKPSTKATIGRRGLYLSLTFQFILVLCLILFYFIVLEIRKALIMTRVLAINNTLLTIFVYCLEITDVFVMCYFVLMVPQLQIYFATSSEVQMFLLGEFVKDLSKVMKRSSLNEERYNEEVKRHLGCILSRYCKIKQLYLDNKKIISYAGIRYILPSSLITVFIIYAAVEKNLNYMTLTLHFMVFTSILLSSIISGQRYEDEWHYFYEALCDLPWYTWNLQNQKAYLLLLNGPSQKVQLIILHTIVVNHSLCLRVWRILYAGASMIYNIHRK